MSKIRKDGKPSKPRTFSAPLASERILEIGKAYKDGMTASVISQAMSIEVGRVRVVVTQLRKHGANLPSRNSSSRYDEIAKQLM